VHARFAITRGPGERLGRRKSPESGKTYPGAILLGPWIIALDLPAVVDAGLSAALSSLDADIEVPQPNRVRLSGLGPRFIAYPSPEGSSPSAAASSSFLWHSQASDDFARSIVASHHDENAAVSSAFPD
jgi:hypothetical protein